MRKLTQQEGNSSFLRHKSLKKPQNISPATGGNVYSPLLESRKKIKRANTEFISVLPRNAKLQKQMSLKISQFKLNDNYNAEAEPDESLYINFRYDFPRKPHLKITKEYLKKALLACCQGNFQLSLKEGYLDISRYLAIEKETDLLQDYLTHQTNGFVRVHFDDFRRDFVRVMKNFDGDRGYKDVHDVIERLGFWEGGRAVGFKGEVEMFFKKYLKFC